MRSFFRIAVDSLVVIMAVVLLLPQLLSYSMGTYGEDVIPDDVLQLDAEIDDVLETAPQDFQELYQNPRPLESYSFRYLEEQTVLTDAEVYRRSVDSIVYITAEDFSGVYFGTGSLLTPDGVVVTSAHVVSDADAVVVTTRDGMHHTIDRVLAVDEALDIAFLKIDTQGLTPLPMGDSHALSVGDRALVIGHSEGFLYSLSVGNISNFTDYRSQQKGRHIQITSPISFGNSGGALLNAYGELVGVPSWSLEYNNNAIQIQNINFAVPMHEALALLGLE